MSCSWVVGEEGEGPLPEDVDARPVGSPRVRGTWTPGTDRLVTVVVMTTRPSTRPSRDPAEAGGPSPETPWRRLSGPVVALVLAAGLVVVTSSVVRGGAAFRLDDLVLASTPGRGNGPAVPDLLALGVVELATPALSVAVVSALTMALCLRTGR